MFAQRPGGGEGGGGEGGGGEGGGGAGFLGVGTIKISDLDRHTPPLGPETPRRYYKVHLKPLRASQGARMAGCCQNSREALSTCWISGRRAKEEAAATGRETKEA